MKTDEPPLLEADVLAIVRAERAIAEPAPDVKARMLAVVSTRTSGPSGGGGGGGPGGRRAPSFALSGWQVPAAVAAAFLLGFVTNAALSTAPRNTPVVARPSGEAAVLARSGASSSPAVSLTDVPAIPPSALPNASPPAPSSSVRTAEPDNKGLAGERALLDVARTALANGDSARALVAVARHESAYPTGLLVEEREAMAVKALVAAGRNEEARARGSRYAKRFPGGLMRPAVDGALRSIPDPP